MKDEKINIRVQSALKKGLVEIAKSESDRLGYNVTMSDIIIKGCKIILEKIKNGHQES